MPAIQVNGERREVAAGAVVADVLRALGLDRDGIAVAVNLHVMPQTIWEDRVLQEGDRVEIIRAVGGG